MITSAANEKIKQVSALVRRSKERRRTGLFTAEGVKLFSEAPKDRIEAVYVSDSFIRERPEITDGTEPVVVRDDLFAKMCDTQTPQGILTVLRQPSLSEEEIIEQGKGGLILLLEEVQDPGNVGTIIRTAEAAGAAGVLLSEGCADLYSPKTIRSTMGSVFRVPTALVRSAPDAARKLREAGFSTYAAHLKGTTDYDGPDYSGSTALFIGNEGKGLTQELTGLADVPVRIPMEGKLDSLNASVAAGILMYTIYRKRKRISAKGGIENE